MRLATAQPTVPSWWIGLDWDTFCAEVQRRFPAMSNSPEGRQTASDRGLMELHGTGKQRSSVRVES